VKDKTITSKTSLVLTLSLSILFITSGPKVIRETCDDLGYMLIAAGAFGPDSQYLLYPNPILGYILKLFYYLIPQMNWYLFFQYFFNVISCASLVYIFSDKTKGLLKLLLPILLGIYTSHDFFLSVQFTVNSFIYIITGFIIIFESINSEKAKYSSFGIFLIILSFLTRWNCALFILPFCIVMMIYYSVSYNTSNPRYLLRKIYPFFIALLFSTILILLSHLLFQKGNDWDEYNHFLKYNTSITDYEPAIYDNHPYEYKQSGITELDIVILNNLISMDTETYTNENLEKIVKIKSQDQDQSLRINNSILSEISRVFGNMLSKNSWMHILILVSILFLIINKQWAKCVTIAVLFGGMIIEEWFLVCAGRALYRVCIGPFMAFELLTLYIFLSSFSTPLQFNKTISIAGITISFLLLLIIFFQPDDEWWQGDEASVLNELSRDKDNIYVLDSWILYNDGLGIKNYMTVSPSNYSGYFDNMVFAGGFIAHAPNISRAGLNNPVRELVNDRVYWVTMSVYGNQLTEVLRCYLEEKLQRDVSCSLIIDINGIQVWKFRT